MPCLLNTKKNMNNMPTVYNSKNLYHRFLGRQNLLTVIKQIKTKTQLKTMNELLYTVPRMMKAWADINLDKYAAPNEVYDYYNLYYYNDEFINENPCLYTTSKRGIEDDMNVSNSVAHIGNYTNLETKTIDTHTKKYKDMNFNDIRNMDVWKPQAQYATNMLKRYDGNIKRWRVSPFIRPYERDLDGLANNISNSSRETLTRTTRALNINDEMMSYKNVMSNNIRNKKINPNHFETEHPGHFY